MSRRKDLDAGLAALQERLGAARGKRFWRSLDELAETPAFQELMRLEFPEQADVWPDSVSRRKFLTVMAASLALAGLGGCSVRPAPSVEILPYVHPPESLVPGRPLFFATAMVHAGAALGLLVESHEGRPTKIEGNPQHPASLGATDALHQAAVLTLYDPDRAQTVTHLGQTRTWDQAVAALREAMAGQQQSRGAGLRILTERVASPTLAGQLSQLLDDYPAAKWSTWEPVHDDQTRRAARWAFGREVAAQYDFSRADVVLSLDADFLSGGAAGVRYAADFMARRRVRGSADDAAQAELNRLYVAETNVSCTGAKADHRLALRPSHIEGLARAVAGRLGVAESSAADLARSASDSATGPIDRWAAAVARDLDAHRGRSLVVAGEGQPAVVHLLCLALNDRLGNVGQTVVYTDPVESRLAGAEADCTAGLRELTQDMAAGRVELLLILAANPVYSAPADIPFVSAMQQVPLRVHASLYADETSLQCHWHLPEAHFLEAWGDARAYDGTASIVQPLIEPLYQGRSLVELLALLTGGSEVSGQQLVRAHWHRHWAAQQPVGEFDDFWQTAVHDGVISDTAAAQLEVPLQDGWQRHLEPADRRVESLPSRDAEAELELVFQPDPTIYDGRFANNGWLQELPKPITKLTWDNAALISPATARRLGLSAGRYAHGGEHGGYHAPVVELRLGQRTVRAPVWIVPGHADDAVTVTLGYGRERAGRVGGSREETLGFNAYRLRTAEAAWAARGLSVAPVNEEYLLAGTQQHYLMEGRDLVRTASLAEYQRNPHFATAPDREHARELGQPAPGELTLYHPPQRESDVPRWGMSIDLTTCVGCSACVVACQAENNIPVVGKEQVAFGREMHWLRIDRYLEGPADDPAAFYFQPLPCMHCEQAPCEYVCPVAATVHSDDGLNDMIYNRCVGTRFCSNNCPYKVRRFNFFLYSDWVTPERRLQYNPDVTVRSRGVMEKCTYCVQRIRSAQATAGAEGRKLVDGEILTACQAVCPTRAIVFGDLANPQSEVQKCHESPLDYALLGDLNTRPRTTYLAALRNPNPELES